MMNKGMTETVSRRGVTRTSDASAEGHASPRRSKETMRQRWLPRFPNYAHATTIDEVPASISEGEFVGRYVETHQPCVIRGGAKHWPAIEKWNANVFRAAVGHVPVGESWGFRYEPMPQYTWDYISEILAPLNSEMTYADFFDEVESDVHAAVQLCSEPLGRLGPLLDDLGGFSFLDLEKRPSRFYPSRLFLARAGYTEWHRHWGDETLTAQILAPKEFLLLPPDQTTFDAMRSMSLRGVWRVPSVYWPSAFAALIPARVVLEPGDVIYIPMHWWHTAESTDNALNISAAVTFRTPLRWLSEMRLPNARASIPLVFGVRALHAVRMRKLAPLLASLELTALSLAGFPLALWKNRNDRDWSR